MSVPIIVTFRLRFCRILNFLLERVWKTNLSESLINFFLYLFDHLFITEIHYLDIFLSKENFIAIFEMKEELWDTLCTKLSGLHRMHCRAGLVTYGMCTDCPANAGPPWFNRVYNRYILISREIRVLSLKRIIEFSLRKILRRLRPRINILILVTFPDPCRFIIIRKLIKIVSRNILIININLVLY